MARIQSCMHRRSRQDRDAKSKVVTRRSRRLKKRKVHFLQEEVQKNESQLARSTAVRSLFPTKSILELPNELVTLVLTYFNAKELLNLRCVCRKFTSIIDHNISIWSKVSYQNLWPTSPCDDELFRRGAEANNLESLVKLGLAHLYHYNLTAGAEKNEKKVKINASLAANYFRSLDNAISPKKPLTWVLIRPPWSSVKSACLKQAIHNHMLKFKSSNCDGVVCYNIGRVLKLESDTITQDALDNLILSAESGCSHATYENLLNEKNTAMRDAGVKLKWFRNLQECANKNMDAAFELCHYYMKNLEDNDFVSSKQASLFCRNLFQNCFGTRIDKLEQKQPKINSLMRCILVDWLAEVAYMKNMSHQVLHATVNYVDQFLTTRVVERAKLQLLGITCLLLAAKSHYDPRQVHILTVRESSWLTDQTYQYEDVVKMMGEIIGTFKGNLWMSTSWDYLNLLHSFTDIDVQTKYLSHYLHDMSLQCTSFGSYKPSMFAASIILLARIILNSETVWPKTLSEYTGYDIKDLANCASLLYYKSFTCPSMKDDRDLPLTSIKDEYMSEKNFSIANTFIPLQIEIKNRILVADSALSCTAQDPLQFVVMSLDFDETLNMSIKSIDYDGDCEDYNDLVSDSSLDEGSFYVGRTRLSSFRSVDEFSDDETTMDADSFNASKFKHSPGESFTPIFHSINEKIPFLENKDKQKGNTFVFPDEPGCSGSIKEEVEQSKNLSKRKNSLSVEAQHNATGKRVTRSSVKS